MLTPVPSVSPVEYCVFCVVCPPTCRTFWYRRSWNAARSDLKPVVLAFARLLAMTAICVFWASRPVFADHSARFIECILVGYVLRSVRQHLFGGLFVLIGGVHALDLKFILTLQFDHVDQRLRGVDVARFQHSRRERHGRIGGRLATVLQAQQSVRALLQVLLRRGSPLFD